MSQVVECNEMVRRTLLEVTTVVLVVDSLQPSIVLFSAVPAAPGPGSVYTDFTEATYPGYAPKPLEGLLSSPVQVVAGQYQSSTSQLGFATSGAGPYAVLGWGLVNHYTGVLFCFEVFDQPWQLTPGNPLVLEIQLNQWSRSVLP